VSTRLPKPLPSSLFFYQQAKTVVSIPTHVLPSRQAYFVDELAPLCTTAEKRAEYDAIIDYKRQHGGINAVDFIKGKGDEKVQGNKARTVVDDKRRPKQYRGKIKSMSPTEVKHFLFCLYHIFYLFMLIRYNGSLSMAICKNSIQRHNK
jgi:hypothetical protein